MTSRHFATWTYVKTSNLVLSYFYKKHCSFKKRQWILACSVSFLFLFLKNKRYRYQKRKRKKKKPLSFNFFKYLSNLFPIFFSLLHWINKFHSLGKISDYLTTVSLEAQILHLFSSHVLFLLEHIGGCWWSLLTFHAHILVSRVTKTWKIVPFEREITVLLKSSHQTAYLVK